MANGARLHGTSAHVVIASVILALLAGSYLIHTWRATAPFTDPVDTFVGSLGLLCPWIFALWRRSRPQPPQTPPSREQWLAALAGAERDRLQEDLRDRGVEVACIAVPWEPAPELADHSVTASYGPPGTGRVDRLRQQLWPGRPPARVVICGPAGSGKSIALHLLAEQLLAPPTGGQNADGPVPVVLSLAGWDARQPLYPWLIGRIADRYPAVVGPQSGVEAQDLTRALLHDGAVVPFLDGFDELAGPERAALLRALNQALGAGLSIALASREEQFRQAVAAVGAVRGSVAVRLRPLGPQHLADFLDDARTPNRMAWLPLLEAMRAGRAPSATEAFATPLMQWLGLQTYGSGTAIPAQLADPARFPTAQDAERHLLASLIPSAFDPLNNSLPAGQRWTARRAWRLLRFLAEHQDDGGIRWWTLYRRAQGQLALVYGLALTALATGLSALSQAAGTALLAGALWGTACGAAFAVAYVTTRAEEYRNRSAIPGGFRSDVSVRTVVSRVVRLLPVLTAAGVATQLVTGLLFTPLHWPDLWALLGQGTALSAAAGLCGGLAAGTVLDRVHTLDANVAPANATRPLELLRRDSKATAVFALCLAFATVLVTWTAWSLNLDRTPPGAFLAAAATAAAVVGPGLFTAWPAFRAAHAWYIVRDQLPLRFSDFMTTAQAAGVLREEGITYYFRHALLRAALRTGNRGPGSS
ncbi:hypothetical protein [Streptomyces sp. GESEQ-4]|uniref:hypothetical protein n=1 Tax=Streptomyces sp. GESEQ-4 TaxID=2812655 RepID=UPI001B32ADEB|nr:hypothetical protein [Streptomyces sp. GESEQ-4]